MNSDGVPLALDCEALLAKSRYYIGKALLRADEHNLEEYQLWASLALELLGKAILSKISPSLVVDPTHTPSLFAASGINITTDIKTITAKTIFERFKQISPEFDLSVQKFCTEISQRRNAELHSGDAPFKAMKREAWESKFWRACKVILAFDNMTLSDWLGTELAATPLQIIETRSAAIEAEVMATVEHARETFDQLPQKERERILAEKFRPFDTQVKVLFEWYSMNDLEWEVRCPACQGNGFLAGDITHEEISESSESWATWEMVVKTYMADEFACPRCKLKLTGVEALEAAGFDLEYKEEEEREIEYEPEYGNC